MSDASILYKRPTHFNFTTTNWFIETFSNSLDPLCTIYFYTLQVFFKILSVMQQLCGPWKSSSLVPTILPPGSLITIALIFWLLNGCRIRLFFAPLQIFVKKEEMIRHYKWHKKREDSLQHGFMRYSPFDDCSTKFPPCTHNKKQTHYHCIQVTAVTMWEFLELHWWVEVPNELNAALWESIVTLQLYDS